MRYERKGCVQKKEFACKFCLGPPAMAVFSRTIPDWAKPESELLNYTFFFSFFKCTTKLGLLTQFKTFTLNSFCWILNLILDLYVK